MGFFLAEKPWAAAQSSADDRHSGGSFALPAAKLGLRLFLGMVTLLFLLLIFSYGNRMAFEIWRPVPSQWLLWLNTLLLLASSAGLQWARISARRGQIEGVKLGVILGGAFTFAFLAGQIAAWRELQAMAFFDITNAAIAFFYLITGLHGLHLVGGLVAWSRTIAKLWRGAELRELRPGVELCAIYWHFLLVVWLVLFVLLFSGNDYLDTLLYICGLR